MSENERKPYVVITSGSKTHLEREINKYAEQGYICDILGIDSCPNRSRHHETT